MKKSKVLLTLIMAAVMILTVVLPVFAADTYTITINKEEAGHKYEAYQIFLGEVSTDEETGDLVLSSITWGSGVTEAGKTALGNAQDLADTLKTTADAEAFAKEVAPYLTSTCSKATYNATDKNYTISDLPAGYYLIKDEDNSLADEEGYTAYILKVVGNTEADPKDGETTFEKKVDDKNDSNTTENELEWHDSADHDIGDAIEFKLSSTIAENYDEYETYYLSFHDTEEKGLTFDPASVKVYVDNKLITTGYEVVTECEDGCTFEVIFEDLKAVTSVGAGSEVVVRYQSVLNNEAVLGNKGNVNKAYAEFSNNPNDEQGGRGETEEDTVIIFTYKVIVNKVDGEMQPLPGATFTLEKFEAAATGTVEHKGVMGNWKALSTVETTPDTTFSFNGLDDGEYRLTETEAPEHYNAIAPIYFTVTAEHEVEWTMDRLDVLTSLSGDVATGEIKFTADKVTGNIGTEIVNERGVILPETGGIGTTIFYVAGVILVIGAALLLITKKKMSSYKK